MSTGIDLPGGKGTEASQDSEASQGVVSRVLGKAVGQGVYAYCRVHAALDSRLGRTRRWVQSVAEAALTDAELEQLGPRLYRGRSAFGPSGLFEWEDDWYRSVLPAPPAKVLVGGCGAGRELMALQQRGYHVLGTDPSASLCAAARGRLGALHPVWAMSYQQWLQPEGRATLAREAPYDAILFGWGSLGYLVDEERRSAVLELACQLCPNGPLLLSFVAAKPRGDADGARESEPRRGRGARLARVLGRARGLPYRVPRKVRLIPHAGVVRSFDARELEQMAAELGRVLQVGGAGNRGYCTLLPRLQSVRIPANGAGVFPSSSEGAPAPGDESGS